MKKLLDFINQYWGPLAILGTIASSVLTFIWVVVLLPMVDAHIDSRVLVIGRDSMPGMVHRILDEQPVGFRGLLADTTKIDKADLPGKLGHMMITEKEKEAAIEKLQGDISYQEGFNLWLLKTLYPVYVYKGVSFYVTPKGTYKYLDMFNRLWDANYNADYDCFFFYPDYSNGDRLKCE